MSLLAFAALPVADGAGVGLAFGERTMVVAGHPEAAAAGVAVLRAGGGAIDAAVAVSLALGVAEPYGSGLGGKLELVYFERANGSVHVVDGMDATGASFQPEAFRRLRPEQRRAGATSVAIPGLPAALFQAHARWGRLPRAEVIAPAARLARDGFEVLPGTVRLFAAQIEKLRDDPELARLHLPGGALPAPGTRLPNPALAETLGLLAREGEAGFYRGPMGAALARTVTDGGGWLTTDDLAGYRPHFRDPVRIELGGFTLVGGTAPANGFTTAALVLKILEPRVWRADGLHDADNLDAFLRACQQSVGAVRAGLADTADASEVAGRMLAPESIARLREAAARADPAAPFARAAEAALLGSAHDELQAAETTHFCIVDADGNAVSATQSLSLHFGSGLVVPGTGVILNNSLSNFATLGGPNLADRAKRPRSTIAPALVLRGDHLLAVVGLPGGARIPTGLAQVLVDHLLLGGDLAAAIAAPRVHPEMPVAAGARQNEVWFEEAPGDGVLDELARRGWAPLVRADTESFGGVTAIERTAAGPWRGIADLRRTNAAAGY